MKPFSVRRLWAEILLALVAAAFAIGTVIVKDWAELIFGIDPDSGNGTFEAAMTVVASAVALLLAAVAIVDGIRISRERAREHRSSWRWPRANQ
jgi:hypothetical protein